ncbi:MAG: PqqD family protein [Rhodospirillales bacterium]|jgi:hypothetical protein|nr:PqqD family protein [Rhodospirillales bacterium]
MPSYEIAPSLLLQAVADETVILDPATGNYFTLNATGTRMLQVFREAGDVEEAVVQLATEFDAPPEVLRRDLVDLLEQLVREGLAQARHVES